MSQQSLVWRCLYLSVMFCFVFYMLVLTLCVIPYVYAKYDWWSRYLGHKFSK